MYCLFSTLLTSSDSRVTFPTVILWGKWKNHLTEQRRIFIAKEKKNAVRRKRAIRRRARRHRRPMSPGDTLVILRAGRRKGRRPSKRPDAVTVVVVVAVDGSSNERLGRCRLVRSRLKNLDYKQYYTIFNPYL